MKRRIHLFGRWLHIKRVYQRSFVIGLIGILLLTALPLGITTAVAANNNGPTLAAWAASELVGVPHRTGGSNPAQGLDNSGLIYYVYQALGVEIPRPLSAQFKFGEPVAKEQLQPGDLVFFNGPRSKSVVHVGIYLTDGDFVASSSSTGGAVRRNLGTSYYQKYYIGARRIASSKFASMATVIGQAAIETVGTPFAAGQASAQGVDNTGLIRYIYGRYYLEVPHSLDGLAETGINVARSQLRIGDMLFFHGAGSTAPYRVGMHVGNNEFVLIDADLGVVVKRSLDQVFYSNRYLGARRPYANYVQPTNFESPAGGANQSTRPATSVAEQLVTLALTHVGKPYQLGASGPQAFDCSGLISSVYDQFGYKLPRASYNQATVGKTVAMQDLEKGDLVFFRNTWRNNGSIDHVAIYIGNGKIVHAITNGVTTSSLQGYWVDRYAGAKRILSK